MVECRAAMSFPDFGALAGISNWTCKILERGIAIGADSTRLVSRSMASVRRPPTG